MLRRRDRLGPVLVLLLLAALAGCATGDGGRRTSSLPAVAPASPAPLPDALSDLAIDVVVTGRDGSPVERLRGSDFEVTVDGARRGDALVAQMYRGPGAASAARSTETAPGEIRPFSQPNRAVVIVVDQASLVPGEEAIARETAETCLGLLALTDRVWVVRLPLSAEAQEVSFDRSAVRESLARLRAIPLGAAGGPSREEPARSAAPGEAAPAPQQSGQDDAAPEAHVPDPFVLSATGAAADAKRAALRTHARVTLDGIGVVLKSMEAAPGGKTMLLLSGGLVASGAQAAVQATVEAAARAHARIVSVQLPTASAIAGPGADGLRRLAEDSGGSFVALAGRSRQPLVRVAEQLSTSYVLLLPAGPEAGGAPQLHQVRVRVPARNDVTVRAASLAAPGLIPRAELSARLSPAAGQGAGDDVPPERPAPAKVKRPAAAFGVPVFRHQHELDGVLARVSQYVAAYGPILSSIVSEESYVQESIQNGSRARRTLVSDFLTVRMDGIEGWLPFRDVFEVDGKRVRDRQDRLARLFIDQPSAERVNQRALEVFAESARYNIGDVRRTLNVPTLPLQFLEAGSVQRFAFKKLFEDELDGTRVWALEYTEVASPTFVRTSEGEDRPTWGRIWVDPLTGTVHRTVLKAAVATITVDYGPWADLPGVWLPLQMTEFYAGAQVISGRARYSKFRRFQVTTDQEIRVPKK
jgi:VWFA-related protein